MRTAKVTGIMAVEIACPECQELCIDQYGSTMITSDSKTVRCDYCDVEYKVPTTAFTRKVGMARTYRKQNL